MLRVELNVLLAQRFGYLYQFRRTSGESNWFDVRAVFG